MAARHPDASEASGGSVLRALSTAEKQILRRAARGIRMTVMRGICFSLLFALLALGSWIAWPLSPNALTRDAGQGVTIVDRHGLPLRSARATDGTDARWIPYDKIDADIINAFIAVEDRRFWDHHGIDPRGVARAVRDNLRARRVVSGASTLTMQLARLMQPSTRSFVGKATQTLVALRLEAHLSKRDILEQYFNRVELGQGTAGIAAAAALYFNASAEDVSVGQAATLAGLAHAPSRDNPHASPRRARARRVVALTRMRQQSFITNDEVNRARDEPLVGTKRAKPFLAPHFTARVLGWSGAARSSHVETSLDVGLQTVVEAEVSHTVDVLSDRGVKHAAAVVLDNATGEVLAWVGSPDFWNPENGQTDMVVSPRQPGSTLKPFLYGLAFDRGITPATVLPDVPKAYPTATGPYRPRNYDRRFRGPTRAREALASSYNVPAVELASRLGTSGFLHTLHLAGFTSLDRDAEYYGLGLSLGNGDVTLVELANAYRALTNGGEWRDWTWRRSSANATTPGRRVISRLASALVLDILADESARIPGFGLATPFDFPFPVAVKTGTSRHFTDNWAVGTTKAFTVAVWAGNFSGQPMEGVSGVTGAGPLLHRVVMATAARVPPGTFATPAELGATTASVCRLSGMLATPNCSQLPEWFVPGTEPRVADDWELDGRIEMPAEYSVPGVIAAAPPQSTLDPRPSTLAGRPSTEFRIVSPAEGDRYSIPPGIEAKYATIPLRTNGAGAERVEWSIDGKQHAGDRWPLAAGTHVIEATSARGETVRVRIVVEKQ